MWLYLDTVFIEVIKTNEAIRVALIQFDLCPYSKMILGHTERKQGAFTWRKDYVEVGRPLQTKYYALAESNPADTLILDFWPSEMG